MLYILAADADSCRHKLLVNSSVSFLWSNSMRLLRHCCFIELLRYVLTLFSEEKDHLLGAFVAGITKINLTSFFTSERTPWTSPRSNSFL